MAQTAQFRREAREKAVDTGRVKLSAYRRVWVKRNSGIVRGIETSPAVVRKSRRELKRSIGEAIAGVLEVLTEQGREPDPNIQILDVAV